MISFNKLPNLRVVKEIKQDCLVCTAECFSCSLDVALDLEIDVTRKYTGQYFFDELKGLADASGVDYKVRSSITRNLISYNQCVSKETGAHSIAWRADVGS